MYMKSTIPQMHVSPTKCLVIIYISISALYKYRMRLRVEDELVQTDNAGVLKRQVNILQNFGKEESAKG